VIKNDSGSGLLNKILSTRERLIRMILEKIGDPNVQALMIALTTGQRDYFDPETYDEFIGAGIVHILAVSGLHVGIIYGLLLLVTRPLSLSSSGRTVRCLIIIPFFLFFAVITGLSPSVVRSIIMFSILLLGITFNRKSSSLNSVFLSAFLLLCYDPGWLWHVGFQLSYAAVLGIIIFHPLINSMYTTNLRFIKWVWNLISISLSAQLTTLPLSLLYFNQFPSYFLLSNLVAIPFAGFYLPGCILFILSLPIPDLNLLVSLLLENSGKLFIRIIGLINNLPGSLIYPVNISMLDSILMFLILMLLFLVLHYHKHRMIRYILFLVFFIIIKDAVTYFSESGQKKIQIYPISGLPVVELIDGHKAYLITQCSDSNYIDKIHYHTENYHIHHNLNYRYIPAGKKNEYVPCTISENHMLLLWNEKSILLSEEGKAREMLCNTHSSADICIHWHARDMEVHLTGIDTAVQKKWDYEILNRIFGGRRKTEVERNKELISIAFY
jgi:competence protein ComEC